MKLLTRNIYEGNQTSFQIVVNPCTGPNCPLDMDYYYKNGKLKLHLVNKYYDISDPTDPVKTFYDDSFKLNTPENGIYQLKMGVIK